MLDQLDPTNSADAALLTRMPADLRPLLPHQHDELEAMGLTVRDFLAFAALFVGDVFDYIRKEPGDSWLLVRRRLTNTLLLDHLSGRHWIGTGARLDREGRPRRFYTWSVTIDLDHQGDPRDLYHRYDLVARALGAPSLVFESSTSGGLHLTYLLTDPIELHQLRCPTGDGIVMRLLASEGLGERDGRIEVHPRGQYLQRGIQNRLRLPFGAGSARLDPEMLTQLTTAPALDLRHVTDQVNAGVIRFLDPHVDWFPNRAGLPHPTQLDRAKQPMYTTRPVAHRDDGNEVGRLWSDGIPGPGAFNSTITTLLREVRRQQVPEEDARLIMHGWLDLNHNGQSRTYNRSPVDAHAELDGIVTRLYERHIARPWGPLPKLSQGEVIRLVAFTSEDENLADPATGEILSRYRVQRLAFDLLRHAKQWVLDHARSCARRLGDRCGRPGSQRWTAAMLQTLRHVWPDPSTPEFIVPIPASLRERLDGKDGHWARWRALQNTGMLSLVRGCSTWGHRAATYRVTLDFEIHDGRLFSDLDSALAQVLSLDEIRDLYTRHYAKRVRAAIGAAAEPTAGVEVDVVSTLLSDVRTVPACEPAPEQPDGP